jgi:signal transduction histidine kinase/membrane protein DedA with SNARE-associated domain
MKEYGYIILFSWSILEGESGLIMAGLLSSTGDMNLYIAIFIAGLGGFTGDQIYFYIGRHNKKYVHKKFKSQRRKFALAHLLLKKYGWPIVFMQRYMYGLRTIIPISIGLTRYDAKTFAIINLISAWTWAAITIVPVWYFGEEILNLVYIAKEHWRIILFVIIFIIILGSLFYFFKNTTKYPMVNQLKTFKYHNELIKTLFEARSAILASNLAAPSLFIYVLVDHMNIYYIYIYIVLNLIILFLRFVFSVKGLKSIKNNNTKDLKKYFKLYLFVLLINSIFLGVTSLVVIASGTDLEIFIILALAFGLIAGALSTNVSIFHGAVFFIIPYLSLILFGLFLFTDQTMYYISEIIMISFIYIAIPATFRIYLSLKNNIDKTIKIKEQQEQLIRAERLASSGEILHNIAHQWRQPLSVISTAASGLVLQKEMDILSDKNFLKYTSTIIKNTQSLSNTIDELRDFMDYKNVQKKLSIQESIKSAIKTTKALLNKHNIKLIFNTSCKKSIIIDMYEGQLKQVIVNIINNAQEALINNGINGGQIFISLEKTNSNIIIKIEDNAKGIPKKIINKIFEPYFTTKHNSAGTGLGLSMCYKIITNNLNGILSVKNTPLGAEFTIELKI